MIMAYDRPRSLNSGLSLSLPPSRASSSPVSSPTSASVSASASASASPSRIRMLARFSSADMATLEQTVRPLTIPEHTVPVLYSEFSSLPEVVGSSTQTPEAYAGAYGIHSSPKKAGNRNTPRLSTVVDTSSFSSPPYLASWSAPIQSHRQAVEAPVATMETSTLPFSAYWDAPPLLATHPSANSHRKRSSSSSSLITALPRPPVTPHSQVIHTSPALPLANSHKQRSLSSSSLHASRPPPVRIHSLVNHSSPAVPTTNPHKQRSSSSSRVLAHPPPNFGLQSQANNSSPALPSVHQHKQRSSSSNKFLAHPLPNFGLQPKANNSSPVLPSVQQHRKRSSSSSSKITALPRHPFSVPLANNSTPSLPSFNFNPLNSPRKLVKRKSDIGLGAKPSAANKNRASSAKFAAEPTRATPNGLIKSNSDLARAPEMERLKRMAKRTSFFSMPRSRNSSKSLLSLDQPRAWVFGSEPVTLYDVALLTEGRKVPELWYEAGDTLVYLYPKSANKGPSFKVDGALFASSAKLAALAHGETNARPHTGQGSGNGAFVNIQKHEFHSVIPNSPSVGPSPNASYSDGSMEYQDARGLGDDDTKQIVRLWFPTKLSATGVTGNPDDDGDVERLMLVRNLFAFLQGQALVLTTRFPTLFHVFVQLSKLLVDFQFSNLDGSNFGEAANSSFNNYVAELNLGDVRESAEKVIEGLVLAEKMKCSRLWNEAFSHGVGRFAEIDALNSVKYKLLTQTAILRLEKQHGLVLEKRLQRIKLHLTDFEFPALFSGIMNSQMAVEREVARFAQWKKAFMETRRFMLKFLKNKHGAWPPKAKNKKGTTETGGLNRRVLRDLYTDLAGLYALMVDRRYPTTRLNKPSDQVSFQVARHPDRRIEALRKVLEEYDYSSPPIYPAMMFDAPMVPPLNSANRDAGSESEGKKATEKKLMKDALKEVVFKTYNDDTMHLSSPILTQWKLQELRSTNGMSIHGVANFRLGAWLFLYVVIQALPMVTVDAPGLQYKSEDVEYFLCQAARGRLPWSKVATARETFRDPLTGNVMLMTADSVELSDEAIYKLAPCWQLGEEWVQDLSMFASTLETSHLDEPNNYAEEQPLPPASEMPTMPPLARQPKSYDELPQKHQVPQTRYSKLPVLTADQASQLSLPHQRAVSEPYSLPQIPVLDFAAPPSPAQSAQTAPQVAHPAQSAQPAHQVARSSRQPSRQSSRQASRPSSRQSSRPPSTLLPDLLGLTLPPGHAGSRDSSRGQTRKSKAFTTLLEKMPIPAGVSPTDDPERASHAASGAATFDQILQPQQNRGVLRPRLPTQQR